MDTVILLPKRNSFDSFGSFGIDISRRTSGFQHVGWIPKHEQCSWHTWQFSQHILQLRTPWHQSPVKHVIVPCVAQEHNHTCSSGSSKHGKPTSTPLHGLGVHGADPNTGEKNIKLIYMLFHEIRSIQETSSHLNPPLHFTSLIKDISQPFQRT